MKRPSFLRRRLHAHPRALGAAILALLSATLPGSVRAQALEVSPVAVEMSGGRRVASLTLVNHADEGGVIQIRPFAWLQIDGEDKLEPSTALVVSPPFTTLGPGESQIVRLVLRQAETAKEATFRVLIDQLPPAATSGSVRMALRVSLPIFVAPSSRTSAVLTAGVRITGPHTGVLTLRNAGGRHARLSRFVLTGPGASPTLPSTTFTYVLAGSERRLPIAFADAAPGVGATIHVEALSDGGDVALDASITSP